MTMSSDRKPLLKNQFPLGTFDYSSKRPALVLAYEIEFEAGGDLRCKLQARVNLDTIGVPFDQLLAEIASGKDTANVKWKRPKFLPIDAARFPKAKRLQSLSVSLGGKQDEDNYAYMVFVIKKSMKNVRFAHEMAIFTLSDEQDSSYLLDAPQDGVQSNVGTVADIEGVPSGVAFFIADFRDDDRPDAAASFNIGLEIFGEIEGVPYITPIIIDPEVRHPPPNGGIPPN